MAWERSCCRNNLKGRNDKCRNQISQIEEALAFTWACERLSDYLIGLTFHIQTDHKPLVLLFSFKNIDDLPLRIQRFRLRMLRFNFSIAHVPGKLLAIADALSRAPVNTPTITDQELTDETSYFVQAIVDHLPVSEEQLHEIKRQQENDNTCRTIVEFCQLGWPEQRKLPSEAKPYFQVASQLSVSEGLLLRNHRIVIPAALDLDRGPRDQQMYSIEGAKSAGGIEIHRRAEGDTHWPPKCRERARQSVWWPRLSRDLEELVEKCPECRRVRFQRPEPLIPSTLPELPWQKVGTDLALNGERNTICF